MKPLIFALPLIALSTQSTDLCQGPENYDVYPKAYSHGYYEYNPMSNQSNLAVRYYLKDERPVYLEGNLHTGYENLFVSNKLIIGQINLDAQAINNDFSTIQQLDFSNSNLETVRGFLEKVKNENNTFISLKKIHFGNINVDIDILELIKNISTNLRSNQNALVRDRECMTKFASIYVYVNSENLQNLKKIHQNELDAITKPSTKRFAVIYMNNPYEERLPYLKIYVTDTNYDY
jgi:hypothetical protein